VICIAFTEEKIEQLRKERFTNDHPRVRRKMEVVFLKSQGISHQEIGKMVGITQNTLRNYLNQYKSGGIEALMELNFRKPISSLEEYRPIIEENFDKKPPATLIEASARIEELTGIKRSPDQISRFLKKTKYKHLKVGHVPAKADAEKQQKFLDEELQPRLEEAKKGKRQVLFVDASHFVHSPFLGHVWSKKRIYIRAPSGRNRHNVLGAFNAVSHELITVKNDAYVNSLTVMDLIKNVRSYYKKQKVTLAMDNASYQRCKAVMEYARENDVELLFLPSYSPNLNLIERLWKFVKKNALNNNYYGNFKLFKKSIENCLENLGTKFKKEVESLMSLKFQIIHADNVIL
jgi:transposase